MALSLRHGVRPLWLRAFLVILALTAATTLSLPRHIVIDDGAGDGDRVLPARFARQNVAREVPLAVARGVAAVRGPRAQLHVATDKQVYRAGERVFVRVAVVDAFDAKAARATLPVELEVVSPKGDVVFSETVGSVEWMAGFCWTVPGTAAGGDYTVRARSSDAAVSPSAGRVVSVRAFRSPRSRLAVDFERKAYAPGETALVSLSCTRAEGGPCTGAVATATARDGSGAAIHSSSLALDAAGRATLRLELPESMSDRAGAALTVAFDDAGTVETRAATIPLVASAADVAVQFFPEGGDVVPGVAQRVYFAARLTTTAEPADVALEVLGADGAVVATAQTQHEGRGSFAFSPVAGAQYHARLTRPAPRAGRENPKLALPATAAADSPSGRHPVALAALSNATEYGKDVSVRVSLSGAAAEETAVRVVVSKREREAGSAQVTLRPGAEQVVALKLQEGVFGVLRVTALVGVVPVAERLVFVSPPGSVQVQLRAEPPATSPGGEVSVTVRTVDGRTGNPISAVVGLTVTDDSVLSLVEKRKRAPRLPAMVYLEGEVRELEDTEAYFGAGGDAAVDLLLGTQGWRRFAFRDLDAFVRSEGDRARSVLAYDERPGLVVTLAAPPRMFKADRAMAAGAPRMYAAAPMRNEAPAEAAVAPEAVAFAVADADRIETAAHGAMAKMAAAEEPPIPAPVPEDNAELRVQDVATREAVPRVVREYAFVPRPKAAAEAGERSEGVDTVYWASLVKTGEDGAATFKFRVGDQVTSFRVMADAISEARSGTLGTGDLLVESKKPFFISPKIPLFVTAGDVARIPVAIVNDLDAAQDVTLSAKIVGQGATVTVADAAPVHVEAHQRTRRLVEVAVQGPAGTVELVVDARAGTNSDTVRANLTIEARGFPVALNHGGTLESGKASTFEVEIPTSALGRVRTSAKVYATPVANLVQALEALVREPFGCFEQASSTTYPATMALQYMKTHQGVPEELVRRAGDVVDKGYKKLVAFETRGGGFEWFGQAPAHEALTAYGLLEFLDMSKVYPVDEALLRRTREYLLGQRLPGGGFRRNSRSLDSFGAAPDSVTNAYILWSMTFAGVREGLDEQIESAVALCETDDDPYLVGLVAGTLLNVGDTARGVRLAGRVAKHLQPSGEVSSADTSITRSSGQPLAVEATSVAVLAWLTAADRGDESFVPSAEAAMAWLAAQCADGKFGSTQGTVLALKAIILYDTRRSAVAPFVAELAVDGALVGNVSFDGRQAAGPLELPAFGDLLRRGGKHVVEVRAACSAAAGCAVKVPYSVRVEYEAVVPAEQETELSLDLSMSPTRLREGESAIVSVNVTNRRLKSHGMIVAVVGVPGGMEVRHERLKELAKAGGIAHYEVLGRDVVLYWRSLGPAASLEATFDAVAAVPGAYEGQAPRAYVYYNDVAKAWLQPLNVTIEAK
eukprot:m51a1_g10818 putative alpha-2-Macroglobulin (1432) ;mRNA; f:50872-55512